MLTLYMVNKICSRTRNHKNLFKKICAKWNTEESRYKLTSSSSFWKHDQSKYNWGPSDIAYKLSGGFPWGGLALRTLLPSVPSYLMASKESKSFTFTTSHIDFKSPSKSVSLKSMHRRKKVCSQQFAVLIPYSYNGIEISFTFGNFQMTTLTYQKIQKSQLLDSPQRCCF